MEATKNVYRLNDASRAWYFRMKEFLLYLGMKVCSIDPALFYYMHKSRITGIICMHFDEIFCVRSWLGEHRNAQIHMAPNCSVKQV